jgi:glycosyltransferase involved in cell wall biosynthesis
VAAIVRRAAFVLEVRDLWPEVPIALGVLPSKATQFLARTLEVVAYARASRIIALSPGMREGVLRVRPSAHVTVIPNACDREVFDISEADRLAFRRANDWGANELIVVYAGSLGRIYDAQWTVETAAHLIGEDVRFILIGDGARRESCKRLADHLGLDSEKVFLGSLSKYETAKYVASSDLALSTVSSEPALKPASINKVFDGLAAGRPILFNHEGWLSSLVCEKNAGWRLSRNTRVAADQIRQIAVNRGDILLARRNAKKLAEDRFLREDLYIMFRDTLLDASWTGLFNNRRRRRTMDT